MAGSYKTIVVDATSTIAFGTTSTVNHTIGNGNNRLLLVGIGTRGGSVSAVTFNGVAMTRAKLSTSYDQCTGEVWYLYNPDIGTHQIAITMNGASRVVGALSLFNVDRANPIYTTGEAYANGDLSLSLTVPTGRTMLSFQAGFDTGTSDSGALSGQTQIISSSSNDTGWAYYENSLAAGSQGMNIDVSGTNAASMAGVLVNPARQGGGGMILFQMLGK